MRRVFFYPMYYYINGGPKKNHVQMVELLSLLQERGPKDEVPLDIVTLPSYWQWREQRKTSWVSRIIRSRLPIKWETYVLLNKLVCAEAAIFLGTQMSTFSRDIERLRYGLGRASCHDIELCYDGRGWVPVNSDGG